MECREALRSPLFFAKIYIAGAPTTSLAEEEEEEEKKRKDDEKRVLPGCRFATLAMFSGDVDVFVGEGSVRIR